MSSSDFDRRLNDWFDVVEPTQLPPALLPQVFSAVQETRQVRGAWHRFAPAIELSWQPRSRLASTLVLVIITALLIVALAVVGLAAGLIRLPLKADVVDGLIAVQAETGADPYTYQVRFIDPRTGEDAFVTPSSVLACGAHFSPDGARFAFLNEDANDEIFVAVAPTVGDFQPTLLVRKPGQVQFDPSWAPDGSALVATIEAAGDGGYRELRVLPADGAPGRRVTDVQASYAADWSASGEWIAFVGVGPMHPLYLIRPDGSDLRLLHPHGVDAVAWSPVRDELAYSSSEDAKVHVISLDGRELFAMSDGRLPTTEPSAGDLAPVWSDDGTRIALAMSSYPLEPRGVLRIFDIEAASSTRISLAVPIARAVWSATGRTLAVVTSPEGSVSGGLWEVSIDGAQQRQIAQGVQARCMSGGAALSWQRLSK